MWNTGGIQQQATEKLRRFLPQIQSHVYTPLDPSNSLPLQLMTSTQVDIVDYAEGYAKSVPFPGEESLSHGLGDKSDRARDQKVIERSGALSLNESVDNELDGSGCEYPTEEDLLRLRKVSGKVPWTAYTIAFIELCERFSYYGIYSSSMI